MIEAPQHSDIIFPENITIGRFSGNTDDYRQLNKLIGGDLGWVDRQIMNDEELEKILNNPGNRIFVLFNSQQPVGFAELDFMNNGVLEMHYFGLVPDARGKGLGKPFLHWTIGEAWKRNPRKLILNTCEIDHPGALPLYQKAGFTIVAERIEKQAVVSE